MPEPPACREASGRSHGRGCGERKTDGSEANVKERRFRPERRWLREDQRRSCEAFLRRGLQVSCLGGSLPEGLFVAEDFLQSRTGGPEEP